MTRHPHHFPRARQCRDCGRQGISPGLPLTNLLPIQNNSGAAFPSRDYSKRETGKSPEKQVNPVKFLMFDPILSLDNSGSKLEDSLSYPTITTTLGRLPEINREEIASSTGSQDSSLSTDSAINPDKTVTTIIGIRGVDRLPGLRHVIYSLRQQTVATKIIVVEQDDVSRLQEEIGPLVDQYLFTYSTAPYNRSWAFNCGANLADTEFLILHDSDLIASQDYISCSLRTLGSGKAALGWSRIQYLTEESSLGYPHKPIQYCGTFLNNQVVGGSLITRRDFYLDIGGMEERFQGWGGEDNAFYDKAVKLGNFTRADLSRGSCLLHYYHDHSKRNHAHGHVNGALVREYAHASGEQIRKKIAALEPIGNPCKFSREKHYQQLVWIIYDVFGWYYYYHALNIQKFAPESWEVHLYTAIPDKYERLPDVIYVLDRFKIDQAVRFQKGHPQIKVIGFFSEHWNWHTDCFFPYLNQCQHLVIMNEATYKHFGSHPKSTYISSGVDFSCFSPGFIPWSQRRPRVLWCGSWAAADDKGLPLMRQLAVNLERRGISVDVNAVNSFHAPRNPPQMADWYRSGTIYVVTSRTEGGPQTALEAASCGLVVVSTPVGLMLELIKDKNNGVLVQRNLESLEQGVNYALDHGLELVSQMQHDIQSWSWSDRVQKTFTLFDRLIS